MFGLWDIANRVVVDLGLLELGGPVGAEQLVSKTDADQRRSAPLLTYE